jgi:hypothetical protein
LKHYNRWTHSKGVLNWVWTHGLKHPMFTTQSRGYIRASPQLGKIFADGGRFSSPKSIKLSSPNRLQQVLVLPILTTGAPPCEIFEMTPVALEGRD